MSRRLPLTLALCAWTWLVWTTRIRNIWGDDDLDPAEQWALTALALSFTVLAAAVLIAVLRRSPWRGAAVKALAGWTIGVWAVRSVGIATGGRGAAFIVVHLVLAAVSIALAVLAVREVGRASIGELPVRA